MWTDTPPTVADVLAAIALTLAAQDELADLLAQLESPLPLAA